MSTDTATELYQAYEGHSKTLKTWLVAYGIGGPVLIVSNESIWARVSAQANLQTIGILFLTGVALQVLIAAVNKVVMWCSYYGEVDETYKSTWKFKTASWFAEQFLFDLLADVGAFLCFVLATIFLFSALS